MTEDNTYLEINDTNTPSTEEFSQSFSASNPFIREQVVNHSRDFGDAGNPPVLSPWAKAAGDPGYSTEPTYSEAHYAETLSGETPSAGQSFDPYSRPGRFGQNASGHTGAPVYGTAPRWNDSGYTKNDSRTFFRPAPEPTAESDKKAAAPVKAREPKYITFRSFLIGMLCCVLLTSGLTLGVLGAAGVLGQTGSSDGKIISATNYTLAHATGNDKSIEEIVAMNENAVVEIMTESVSTDSWLQSYVTQGAGSGIIVDSRGYIMTCNHVISGARTITVTTKSGDQYSASVVGTDAANDVAVIKIEGTGFVAATYGNSDDLSVGDLAVAIGNPLGRLGGTATTGIISALDRELTIDGRNLTLLQTDASINPGNSGGGLFDGEGNLIGLVVAKSGGSNVEGLGFAIPINTAAPITKEIIENGSVTKAYIGISVLNIDTEDMAKTYGFESVGVFITEVNSVEARKAGLETGDKIIRVGDTEVTDYDSLSAALAEHEPGDKVTVTVLRGGDIVEVQTKLIAG